MPIYKSAEDYLETILILKNKINQVRAIDIVSETGYSKPSVSVAMKKLRQENYIIVDQKGFINLTDKGYIIANDIYNKHRCLAEFFMALGVCEETALNDACKIEHEISEETFNCLKIHFDKYKNSK